LVIRTRAASERAPGDLGISATKLGIARVKMVKINNKNVRKLGIERDKNETGWILSHRTIVQSPFSRNRSTCSHGALSR
jgi:hypothetical protein